MIAATLLMSSLPFFAVDFPVDQLPTQFKVDRYLNGEYVNRHTIVATDKQYLALAALLRSERRGWHTDYASYVPRLTFRARDMRINCIGDPLVVDYKTRDGVPRSISKKIPARRCPNDAP